MTRYLALILVVAVALIAACVPAPQLLDDTLLHDTSLIDGEPCGPPCFREITPGETNWNDAITILEDDPDFSNVQVQPSEDENDPGIAATWQEGDNSQSCCQIATDDGEVVTVTFLRTAPGMTLSQLIDARGEPPYLTGQEFTDDQAVGSLVYPDQLMVVYVFVEGATTGEFKADSQIIGALYMTQDQMNTLMDTAELHAWQGYQSYKTYNESELVVTPSVTLTPTPES